MDNKKESTPLPYPFSDINLIQDSYIAPAMREICDIQNYIDQKMSLILDENQWNELANIRAEFIEINNKLDETNKTLNGIKSALGKLENALALFRRRYYHDISKEDYDQLLDLDDQIFDLKEQSRSYKGTVEELMDRYRWI